MKNFLIGEAVRISNPSPLRMHLKGCLAMVEAAFKNPVNRHAPKLYSVILWGNGETVRCDEHELELAPKEETTQLPAPDSTSTLHCEETGRCRRCGKPGRLVYGLGRCEAVDLGGRRCGGALAL